MKAWSVIGLLFAAAIFATIPISPQVTPRGVELSVDQAQAITYGRYRRVHRRFIKAPIATPDVLTAAPTTTALHPTTLLPPTMGGVTMGGVTMDGGTK
jgi:hypothetical protein